MSDYTKTIKTINILEKILKQEYVSIKKTWAKGSPEIIDEINKKLKEFINNELKSMLCDSSDSKTKAAAIEQMSDAEFNRTVQGIKNTIDSIKRTGSPSVVPDGHGMSGISDSVKEESKKVINTLESKGFNPHAELQDRIRVIKDLEASIKKIKS